MDIVPPVALLRVLTWLSPAFPVGAFAYSSGLERAVHDRLVTDAASLRQWIATQIMWGTTWNDTVLLAESYRTCGARAQLTDVLELASALAGSRERQAETSLLGEAFVAAAAAWPHPVLDWLGRRPAYPVAVGAVAGAHAVGLEAVLLAYLHAGASQLVSAGIRLGVCGQRAGTDIMAALEETIATVAHRASVSSLDDLGSAVIGADIASLKHETQITRLFRS